MGSSFFVKLLCSFLCNGAEYDRVLRIVLSKGGILSDHIKDIWKK